MKSELFDIRGRTWVGFECYYAAAPALLRTLCEHRSPEALGRAMRRPGSRPYYLQLMILMSNYLSAREQRVLATGTPPEASDPQADADLATVVDFVARTAGAYRTDGAVMPTAPDFDMRILSEDWIARCAALLGPRERLPEIQRFVATLSLYGFLLHGEQRDGTFDHGPYALPDGTRLLVRELNDLDNRLLPWAEHDDPLPIANVCVAYALRDVEMQFSLFGGSLTDPVDFLDRTERVALFTREGDDLRALEPDEMAALAHRAGELQLRLYQDVVAWPAIERSRYGLYLYANHLAPFFRLAGAEAALPALVARFEAVGGPVAEALAARDELPEIFTYYADIGEGDSAFSPRAAPSRERERT
ncbi:hypothetical protein DSM104299_00481 [Baekduia alba]|uniref:hypothetical protein n=1 Tax=Baekduia alba TaxID=2997333 RepID=UPI0023409CE4|nr:hypothetical protein [Baekduia alba]WCB91804.1 hypothetical protein DSM104299_00481 [Baekduia alba]